MADLLTPPLLRQYSNKLTLIMKNESINLDTTLTSRLTKAETKTILRISNKTLERRMLQREIGYEKDGRHIFFTMEDINKYRVSRKVRACGVPAR